MPSYLYYWKESWDVEDTIGFRKTSNAQKIEQEYQESQEFKQVMQQQEEEIVFIPSVYVRELQKLILERQMHYMLRTHLPKSRPSLFLDRVQEDPKPFRVLEIFGPPTPEFQLQHQSPMDCEEKKAVA